MGPSYEMDDFKFQLFLLCEIPRLGRFRAALRVRHFDKSWEFLCIQLSARKLRNSVNFYTDVKNYSSFMYLYKSIQENRSYSDDPLRDLRVLNSHFEKPQIY